MPNRYFAAQGLQVKDSALFGFVVASTLIRTQVDLEQSFPLRRKLVEHVAFLAAELQIAVASLQITPRRAPPRRSLRVMVDELQD